MSKILHQVISGGQTGVDQAGLRAAKSLGILTGGWMPKYFKTTDGPNPELAKEFGLWQHPSELYPQRTRTNIAIADLTIQIATNLYSPGEKLTTKFCNDLNKINYYIHPTQAPEPKVLALKIFKYYTETHKKVPLILNIAGNSEKTSPGIGKFAEDYLTKVFTEILNAC